MWWMGVGEPQIGECLKVTFCLRQYYLKSIYLYPNLSRDYLLRWTSEKLTTSDAIASIPSEVIVFVTYLG